MNLLKVFIASFAFTLVSINASPQRIIYSRTVTLDIPAKETKKNNTTSEKDTGNTLYNNTIKLIQKIDSITISEKQFSTEVIVDIDTISENNARFQTTKFTFQPVQETIQDISDYPSGNYSLKSSSVSVYLANIAKEALQKKILSFISKKAHLLIKIKGSADATAIKEIRYRNEFGDINHSFYSNNEKRDILLTNTELLTQNEELAFLRTLGIRNFLEENIPELQNFNVNFEHYIDVSDKTGGIYRRVSIEVIIKDQL